jgi:hypothetical protein
MVLIAATPPACIARLAFVALISAIERLYLALFPVGRRATINVCKAALLFLALPTTTYCDCERSGTKQDTGCLHLHIPRAFVEFHTAIDASLVKILARIEAVASADIARVGVGAAAVGAFLERARLMALDIASTILLRAIFALRRVGLIFVCILRASADRADQDGKYNSGANRSKAVDSRTHSILLAHQVRSGNRILQVIMSQISHVPPYTP